MFGNSVLLLVSKNFEAIRIFLAEICCYGRCWQTKVFILQKEKGAEWHVYYLSGLLNLPAILLMLVVLIWHYFQSCFCSSEQRIKKQFPSLFS